MAASPEHAARILGLSLEASLEEVKRVRRKLALKYHPDRCADKEQATRHMGRINAAADTLTSHIKKHSKSNATRKASCHAEFSARQHANQSKARPKEHELHTRSHAPKQGCEATRKTKSIKTTSRAESALIRFATASYASVLESIGTKQRGPTIDVNIMSFQGAH